MAERKRMSRRGFLKVAGLTLGVAALTGCKISLDRVEESAKVLPGMATASNTATLPPTKEITNTPVPPVTPTETPLGGAGMPYTDRQIQLIQADEALIERMRVAKQFLDWWADGSPPAITKAAYASGLLQVMPIFDEDDPNNPDKAVVVIQNLTEGANEWILIPVDKVQGGFMKSLPVTEQNDLQAGHRNFPDFDPIYVNIIDNKNQWLIKNKNGRICKVDKKTDRVISKINLIDGKWQDVLSQEESRYFTPEEYATLKVTVNGVALDMTFGLMRDYVKDYEAKGIKINQGPKFDDQINAFAKLYLVKCCYLYNFQNNSTLTLEQYCKKLNEGNGKIVIIGQDESSKYRQNNIDINVDPRNIVQLVAVGRVGFPVYFGGETRYLAKSQNGKMILGVSTDGLSYEVITAGKTSEKLKDRLDLANKCSYSMQNRMQNIMSYLVSLCDKDQRRIFREGTVSVGDISGKDLPSKLQQVEDEWYNNLLSTYYEAGYKSFLEIVL